MRMFLALLLALLPCGAYAGKAKKVTQIQPVSIKTELSITDNNLEINKKVQEKTFFNDMSIILMSSGISAAAIGVSTAIIYGITRSMNAPPLAPGTQALIIENPQNNGIYAAAGIIGGTGVIAIAFGVYFLVKAKSIRTPPKVSPQSIFEQDNKKSVIITVK